MPVRDASQTAAIIPVKGLAQAKLRLSAVLSPAERRRLVLTMLEDVLSVVSDVSAISDIIVVTPDADVAALAMDRGAQALREEGQGGLNPALVSGLALARSRGAGRALVLPADVPLATAAEIAEIVDSAASGARSVVTVVPSRDGAGTNALLLSPPDAMQPEFGEGSFVRHVAQAVALGLEFRVLRLAGVGADIDEPRDLNVLSTVRCAERYAFIGPEIGHAPRGQERKA
jgi:2-phospho-L-lactate/phosphoenolpyruvate guanylyltransferase